MNDELFIALSNLIKTMEKFYAANPEQTKDTTDIQDPTVIEYGAAFEKAKHTLKKYAPLLKSQRGIQV